MPLPVWRSTILPLYLRNWRSSFSDARSIAAYMSGEASLARMTGPFVQTVTSATWLFSIDGFFSTHSSTSTCMWSPSRILATFGRSSPRRTRGSGR